MLNKSFYFIYEAILFHEEVRGQNFKRCRLYNIQSDVDYTKRYRLYNIQSDVDYTKRCRLYNIQSDVDYTTYKAM